MTRPGRDGPARSRWCRAALLSGAFAVVTSAGPACGERDGAARPTAPASSTSAPAPATTRPKPVARFKGFSDPAYSRGDSWLCGLGAATTDRCLVANQDTTVVRPDGRVEVRASEPNPDPAFDCFYVYPSIGFTGDVDLAMAKDTTTEDALVYAQAARLRERCRVYAALFRQAGPTGNHALAYGDVRAAFRHYMGQWNGGRRLVLFGHGQGADHLARLLQEEFEDDPELRALLIAAYLVGAAVDVATGARTGGTFRTIPACGSPTDTGCVVAWSTTSPSTPRDVAARWGSAAPGRTRLCVNPANPGGGPGPLTAIVGSDDQQHAPGDIGTPFVELPAILTAECVTSGQITTLVVRPTAADDRRNPGALVANAAPWGLHLTEVSLALGSILELMAQQAASPR